MDHDELRRQVMRRLRYGLNVVALERDMVPPEGPFDVALTNGLVAIAALILNYHKHFPLHPLRP